MPGSALLRLTAASAVCAATAAGLVSLAPAAGAVTSDASAYLSRLNQERVDHGLARLTMRSDLNAIAQRWAQHMAATQTLAHNPGLATQVSNWQVVGENVGEGPTIGDLTSAFWNSAAHRDNILDRTYRDVGIGTVNAGGVIWITVDFRDPQYAESSASVVHPASTRRTSHAATRRAATHPLLHVGSRGHAVQKVQRRLHVQPDGIFGPITRRAVVHFQRRHRIHANGVVGSRTWRALHL